MTEQQSRIVAPILNTIVNDDVREFANVLVEELPPYIWEVGASSTGKYHPAYSLGEGGLMRHQVAVVRFLNYFFDLEQYNTLFSSREMDLMRVAGLVHDGRKSGEQSDYERSKFTKFDHPIQMANVIRSYDGKYLNHDEIEFVAHCIASHMGQWNTDRKSSLVLDKPKDGYQFFVHLADYLASRKDLMMAFDNIETPKVTPTNVDDYVITFGKHKGTKLVDLFNQDRSYCMWLKENSYQREVVEMIKQIEAKQAQEDNEI
jgi:6-pyruvoyl-tetrahydropterin synthase